MRGGLRTDSFSRNTSHDTGLYPDFEYKVRATFDPDEITPASPSDDASGGGRSIIPKYWANYALLPHSRVAYGASLDTAGSGNAFRERPTKYIVLGPPEGQR